MLIIKYVLISLSKSKSPFLSICNTMLTIFLLWNLFQSHSTIFYLFFDFLFLFLPAKVVFLKLVPSKSQIPTIFGQEGSSCTVLLAPSVWLQTNLHFDTVDKTKYLFLRWIFWFFEKIRLERTNIRCSFSGNLSKQEWRCQNISKVVPRV